MDHNEQKQKHPSHAKWYAPSDSMALKRRPCLSGYRPTPEDPSWLDGKSAKTDHENIWLVAPNHQRKQSRLVNKPGWVKSNQLGEDWGKQMKRMTVAQEQIFIN